MAVTLLRRRRWPRIIDRTLLRWVLVLAVAGSTALCPRPPTRPAPRLLTRGIPGVSRRSNIKRRRGAVRQRRCQPRRAVARADADRLRRSRRHAGRARQDLAQPAEHAFDEAALIDPKFVAARRSSGARARRSLANQARPQASSGRHRRSIHFEVGVPGDAKADAAVPRHGRDVRRASRARRIARPDRRAASPAVSRSRPSEPAAAHIA